MRKLNAADLFCGAGGTSQGAEQSGAAKVRFALNHWQTAVDTHSANFPDAKHVNSRLDAVSPSEAERIDLLFASPECTHHSRARGGRPTSDQQRSGAWQVLPWIEHHRPSFVVIENVVEFRDWGPVGTHGRPLETKKGHTFAAWLTAIESMGYRCEVVELNAADFGAATSRNRLFVIARKGNRSPAIPEPTHARNAGGELPGMGLQRWRPAADVIDWTIPCPSVFFRKRPLADKTLLRIEAGLRRFVGPFVAQWDNQSGGGSYTRSIDAPFGTIVTKANAGLVTPFQVVLRNNMDAAAIDAPVPTITAGGGHSAVAVPFLAEVNHGGDARLCGIHSTLGTITAKNGRGIALPWISHYYGTNNMSSIGEPLDTITTKGRHSLCLASIGTFNDARPSDSQAMRKLRDTMRELGVCDIGFRMFQNHELAAAQGFPTTYQFRGTKADVTRQIGNSVSPDVAEAITLELAS